MAIVWHCAMSLREYASAGSDLAVPRPDCPGCQTAMIFFGRYERAVRLGGQVTRLAIRRARCRSCRVTHALLPDFVALFRLDGIEDIGDAIEQMATCQSVKAAAGTLPYTTVRDWRRRFASRAELLAKRLLAATVALGDLVGHPPGEAMGAAVFAIGAAGRAARRRFGPCGGDWRVANRVVGGHLLSTNTDPPWIVV
jgi:Domain of unknown function (DUF6431)